MKPAIFLTALAVVATAYAAVRYCDADRFEWELLSHVPTSHIEDSKRLRVFAGDFEVSPAVVDLGDTSYKIEAAWIEYRTEPRRISAFATRQDILPEMVLTVHVTAVSRSPLLAQTGIRIKDEKGGEVYG